VESDNNLSCTNNRPTRKEHEMNWNNVVFYGSAIVVGCIFALTDLQPSWPVITVIALAYVGGRFDDTRR